MAGSKQSFVSRVGHVVLHVLLGFNIMAILLLWAVAASQWVSPDFISFCAVACMTFPVMVVVNALFIPFWFLVHVRYTPIPLVGLLACAGSIQSYYPIHIGSTEAKGDTLRVMTFNTYSWGRSSYMDGDENLVVRWCIEQQADIMILQEAKSSTTSVAGQIEAAGYTLLMPEDAVGTEAIVTRLPVVDCKEILIPTIGNNSAVIAHLLHGTDTMTVISAHLESFHLTDDDRDEYVSVVRNPTENGNTQRSRALMGKMRPLLAMHGVQADTLLTIVDSELAAGRRVLLGGDFNDVPNSYAAARMRSRLTDCYRAAGSGFGFTFNESLMFFRIDHLFCSPSFRPIRTWVDKSMSYSDHYPVMAVLEL